MGQNPLSSHPQRSWVFSQGVQVEHPNNIEEMQTGTLISSLRTETLKLIRNSGNDELYDLKTDPNEQKNISGTARETYTEISHTMDIIISDLGALSRKNTMGTAIDRIKNLIQQR